MRFYIILFVIIIFSFFFIISFPYGSVQTPRDAGNSAAERKQLLLRTSGRNQVAKLNKKSIRFRFFENLYSLRLPSGLQREARRMEVIDVFRVWHGSVGFSVNYAYKLLRSRLPPFRAMFSSSIFPKRKVRPTAR